MQVLQSQNVYMHSARILSTYPEDRTVDVQWLDMEGTKRGVVVITDPGNDSFPKVGGTGLVIGTGTDNFYIGKIDYNYRARTEGKVKDPDTGLKTTAKNVKDGNIHYENPRGGNWLSLLNDGSFSLFNSLREGLKYMRSLRFLRLSGRTVEMVADLTGNSDVLIRLGTAIRNIPGVGEQPVVGMSGGKAIEILTQIAYNKIQTVRFHLGEITDLITGATPEIGLFGKRLNIVLETTKGPVPLGALKMDEAGNIELVSTSGTVLLGGTKIQLGGLAAAESVVKGNTYTSAESTFLGALSTLMDALTTYFISMSGVVATPSPGAPFPTAATAATLLPQITIMKTAIEAFSNSLNGTLSVITKTI